MTRIVPVVALLLALGVPRAALADDAAERKKLHPWARLAPGSKVTIEVRSTGGAAARATETLVAIGDDTCKIQRVLVAKDDDTKRKASVQEWPLAFGGWAHTMPDAVKDGEESVKVDGKEYPCTIWKAVWKAGAAEITERTWMSPDHDLPLQIETTSGKSRREMVAFKLDVEIDVAGQKIKCIRYVGESETNGARGTVESVRSLEVPGGIVASRSVRPAGPQGDIVNVNEVVTFEAKPAD